MRVRSKYVHCLMHAVYIQRKFSLSGISQMSTKSLVLSLGDITPAVPDSEAGAAVYVV